MRNADLSAFGVPPEQFELVKQKVAEFWSVPAYLAFVGLVERIFAIGIQLSLTGMVLYSVAFKKPVWFWIALLWHSFVDAILVYLAATIDQTIAVKILTIEAVVGICAAISLGILYRLRPRFVKPQAGSSEPVIA